MNSKVRGRERTWPVLRQYPSTFLKEYGKPQWSTERESNQEPSSYKAEELISWSQVLVCVFNIIIFLWRCGPTRAMTPFMSSLDHTQRLATLGRTPLDKWSVCRRDLYLTIHNSHNRQTSMPRRDSNPQST